MSSKPFSIGLVGRVSESAAIVSCESSSRVRLKRAPGIDWKLMREGDVRASISRLLTELAESLGLSLFELASATRSVAVAVSGTDNRFSTGLLEQCFVGYGFSIESIRMCGIAEASHVGAFLGKPGLVIRCGHGVSMFIRTESGYSKLIGGWGAVTGDRGSGPWLGRKALMTVTEVLDGYSSKQRREFAEKLTHSANSRSFISLIEHLETARFRSGELGVRLQLHYLGVLTIALAEEHDPWALELVRRSREQILETVEAALHHVRDGSIPICFRGAILEEYPFYCHNLASDLLAKFPALTIDNDGCRGAYSATIGAGLLSLDLSTPNQIQQSAKHLAGGVGNEHDVKVGRGECCSTRLISNSTVSIASDNN